MSIDIEDLNKSQIILLTLLVSFVTSIATGIVTVSLMEKAPKDVVRVTQKVIERVVEKVEDANPIKKDEQVKERIIEKTIVIKEGDIMAQSIAENRTKLLSIFDKDSLEFVSFAVPVDKKHVITDVHFYDPNLSYFAKTADGKEYKLKFVRSHKGSQIALFAVEGKAELSTIQLASSTPILGQTVFFFTSPDFNQVSQSIISSIAGNILYVDLNKEFYPGTAIFDTRGKLLGISTYATRQKASNAFISTKVIENFLKSTEEGELSDYTKTDAVNTGAVNTGTSSTSSIDNTTSNSNTNQDLDTNASPSDSSTEKQSSQNNQ